jgi:(2Fe-2S) ferredoxin
MFALVAASIAVVMFLSRAERITIEEPVYQYVFPSADEYEDGISMKKTKDGLTIDNGLQQYETNDYPFYFKNRDALILTNNFLYMDREASYLGRVEYFSQLALTEDGGVVLDDPDGRTVYGGMLHDGKDVFLFLEETSVTYGDNTITIPALSTVVCFQGTSLLVYPYGEENAIYTELDESGATAVMENGITVDLVNDIYYKPNGTKFLLYSSPDVFEVVSKGQEA